MCASYREQSKNSDTVETFCIDVETPPERITIFTLPSRRCAYLPPRLNEFTEKHYIAHSPKWTWELMGIDGSKTCQKLDCFEGKSNSRPLPPLVNIS